MSKLTDTISLELNGLAQRLNVKGVFDQTISAKTTQLAANSSQLGLEVGKTLGGMMSLTQELDLPTADLANAISGANSGLNSTTAMSAALPTGAGVVNRGVVMLAANPPGMTIQKDVSSSNSDLEALVEDAVTGGLLNQTIVANNPIAISKALARAGGVPVSQARKAIEELVPQLPEIRGAMSDILGNVEKNIPIMGNLSKEIGRFKSAMSAIVDPGGLNGVISNVLNNLNGGVTAGIRGVVRDISVIPKNELDQALVLLQQGDVKRAGNILSQYSDLSTADLEKELGKISVNLSDSKSASGINAPISVVASTTNPGDEPRTGPTVGSGEELLARIACIDREITELVVSSTYTYLDQDPTSASISGWHFLITKTGDIQQCMPLQNVLSDPSVGNHTKYTIGVLMAGGVNANTFTKGNKADFHSNTAYSRAQWNSLNIVMETFFAVYPFGQVVDAEQIPVGGQRPSQGLNASGIASSTFNKTTIIPVDEGSKSIAELQALMLAQLSLPGSSTPVSTTTGPVDLT